MECPHCGYLMDDFTTECPKCTRLKAQGKAPTPAATAAQVGASLPAAPPRQQRKTPELGWPITITLWAVIGMNCLMILAVIVSAIFTAVTSAQPHAEYVDSSIYVEMAGVCCIPILALVGAIAAMRQNQWGVRVMAVFNIAPGLIAFKRGVNAEPLVIICVYIPAAVALAALICILPEWDSFE